MHDRWLTRAEAAVYLCVPERWFVNWAQDGGGPVGMILLPPPHTNGKPRRLYRVSDLDAFVLSQKYSMGTRKPHMSRYEFEAGCRMTGINSYATLAKALDCTVPDIWAYIQGIEAVPHNVARRLRKVFAGRRKWPPPRWWEDKEDL